MSHPHLAREERNSLRLCIPALRSQFAVIASFLVLALAADLPAQSREAAPWTQIVVESTALGKRTIHVATPDGYGRSRTRYPVLVLLDAEDQPMFRLGVAQATYLAANADGVPPFVVVGIVNGKDRIHDMTPPPTGSSIAAFKTAGGASVFADFILRDVLPAVRAKYRTLPMTVLAGHSAGGLFALDVAATRPDSFQGIIAMDPAIWFNDGAPARLYADAIARSSTSPRVFAGHGGLEADIDRATAEFSERLDAVKPPTVAFAHRRYPGDSHALVPVSALPDGLRFVFAPVSTQHLPITTLDEGADATAVIAALAASETQYAAAARSLRLPEALPEAAVHRVARFAFTTLKDADLSLRVLERNVALHPESARAVARLADGFVAKGDLASAIVQFKRAIALAPSSQTELPADARTKLRELERKTR
jgi:predicted alpha/beta superfamily hydrolase